MNHQAMEALYNERLKNIEHIINIQSADDPDMKQEGLLAAYLALRSQPTATDRYLLNKSQWEMVDSVRKGRSVDNGFYKRKDLKIIHYDQLPSGEGVFSAVLGEYAHEPVDEQAIFRIDLGRFFEKLSRNERSFIRFKVMDGLSDVRIQKRLGITFDTLKAMKVNIRKQIQLSFAG
jgi:DNA-directed RNA polymerase specialized sigma24 family protein